MSSPNSSVSRLIHDAEQAKILAAMDEARRPALSVAQLLDGLRRQIDGKVWWLERYGDGRRFPSSEIDAKRRQLAELVQARDMIKAGAGGAGGKASPK